MNIYRRKQVWKLLLFIFAMIIVGISLWYTNRLVKRIADDERNKVELWAKAIKNKAKLVKYTGELFEKLKSEERKKVELWAEANRQLAAAESDFGFILEVIKNNESIPVILADDKYQVNASRNLDSAKSSDKQYLETQLQIMKNQHEPIKIEISKNKNQYLYYKDSKLFEDLKLVFDSIIKSFISEVAINTASVPVLFTNDSGIKVIASGNIDSTILNNPTYLKNKIEEMRLVNTPISVDLGEGGKNYIYYENSYLLTQLKYYPWIQFGVIGLFLLIGYILFSSSRRAEQNQVWVGMSKETAHQLGTPLSSLMAWLDFLKQKYPDEALLKETDSDIQRLMSITERFSKIGSKPKLDEVNLESVLNHAISYLKPRTSKNINFYYEPSSSERMVEMSVPLFEWVIENLSKNAIDAMEGKGDISYTIIEKENSYLLYIKDTGKGIPKANFKTVFQPGYTTKQRGWGLGLSLVKRIIEEYHKGRIYVSESYIGKGTTFCIELKKAGISL
jgi:two-component sensor histidine kinase